MPRPTDEEITPIPRLSIVPITFPLSSAGTYTEFSPDFGEEFYSCSSDAHCEFVAGDEPATARESVSNPLKYGTDLLILA